jgi:recombinational DNA repair protein (RecF pathway)
MIAPDNYRKLLYLLFEAYLLWLIKYLADDAEPETVARFFEVYLLWLFGFVLFCNS